MVLTYLSPTCHDFKSLPKASKILPFPPQTPRGALLVYIHLWHSVIIIIIIGSSFTTYCKPIQRTRYTTLEEDKLITLWHTEPFQHIMQRH